jgi:hypothetical protein
LIFGHAPLPSPPFFFTALFLLLLLVLASCYPPASFIASEAEPKAHQMGTPISPTSFIVRLLLFLISFCAVLFFHAMHVHNTMQIFRQKAFQCATATHKKKGKAFFRCNDQHLHVQDGKEKELSIIIIFQDSLAVNSNQICWWLTGWSQASARSVLEILYFTYTPGWGPLFIYWLMLHKSFFLSV